MTRPKLQNSNRTWRSQNSSLGLSLVLCSVPPFSQPAPETWCSSQTHSSLRAGWEPVGGAGAAALQLLLLLLP